MIEDKNIERCLSWLEDNLKLTKREEMILKCIAYKRQFTEETTLDKHKQNYVLNNYKTKRIEEIAFELREQPSTILEFLDKREITGYKKGHAERLTQNDREYILKYYKTKNIAQLANDLDMLSNKSCIRAFLTKRGLRAVSDKRKKPNAKQP